MKFKYKARTKDGELQAGFIDSSSKEGAVNVLTTHNLFVLSVESVEERHWYDKLSGIFKRVKLVDLMIFTRQFATLMESEISLSDSLRNLEQQTKNRLLKDVIYEISNDVNSGLALSQAMERQGNVFPEFYVSMIRSAEITGRLQESAIFLADYLDKEVQWQSRIRNAMIYPVFVIGVFAVVLGIMTIFVFPQLEPVFKEFNVELPLITKIMMGAGRFIFDWWWAFLGILGIFIFFLIDYFRSSEGKAIIDQISIRIPILGNLFKKMYVARFAEITSVLIKGGVPAAQSIEIASHSIGNVLYQQVLHNIADSIRSGELLSRALSDKDYFFPSLVGQMVAIGENTGRLDSLLSRVSVFYTREVNDVLDNLIELIQPALIVVVGIVISLLFAAVMLPIFNLAQGF